MTKYSWLAEAYCHLANMYQSESSHHALLLQAKPGIGMDALAIELSALLMCHSAHDNNVCAECHSCHLMKAGTHPDWHILLPEKGKTVLGIDQVRELRDVLYQHAQQSGAKVVWIPNAYSVSEAAANALLKMLEEPPAQTYFLLGCHEPRELLATLRSRCFHYYIKNPDEHEGMKWLAQQHFGMSVLEQKTALRLTGGAPLAAQQLLDDVTWKGRQQFCVLVKQLVGRGEWPELLKELNQDNVSERLHWLCSLLLDASKIKLGIEQQLLNVDCEELVRQMARQMSVKLLQRIAQDCNFCRYELKTVAGLNKELILTERLYRWERWSSTILPH